jgi:hypothetical protein
MIPINESTDIIVGWVKSCTAKEQLEVIEMVKKGLVLTYQKDSNTNDVYSALSRIKEAVDAKIVELDNKEHLDRVHVMD